VLVVVFQQTAFGGMLQDVVERQARATTRFTRNSARGEAAFNAASPLVWERIQQTVEGATQIDETGSKRSGYKGQSPPRDGLSRGGSGDPGRSRWEGATGDKLTLVAACRDVLRVIRAEHGSKAEDLRPALDETEILSGKIDEVWHDEWRG
jgi:hypothetical protein